MQLWVISGDGGLTNSEFIDLNEGTTTAGPDLPVRMDGACASYINSSHVIISNQYPLPGVSTAPVYYHSFIVDMNNNFAITVGPDIPGANQFHTCGCTRFMHPNGTNYVVLASGDSSPGFNTRIISETLDAWIEGKIVRMYSESRRGLI